MMRMRMGVGFIALTIVSLALASPALSQESDDGESEPETVPATEQRSPIAAAGWCVIAESDSADRADRADSADNSGEADDAEPDSARPGCDIGIGIALQTYRKLSWVAVIGTGTIGTGLAWTAYRPPAESRQPVIAVAIGIVTSYSADGISSDLHPAIGATLSFGRGAPAP